MSGRTECFREHARSYRNSARAQSAAGNAPSTAARWIGPSAARECRSHRKRRACISIPCSRGHAAGCHSLIPSCSAAPARSSRSARRPGCRPCGRDHQKVGAAPPLQRLPILHGLLLVRPPLRRPARSAQHGVRHFGVPSCERAFLRGRSAEETENARYASPGAGLDGKPLRANATSNAISGTPRWLHQTRGARHAECFRRSRRPDCARR
jgi:hypothetical protein